MKKKARTARRILTILNTIVIVVCIAAILLLLLPTAYHWITKENKPVFGRYLYVNTNNSLTPVMKQNDIIAVEPLALEKMAVGDFLCYYPVLEKEKGVQFGRIDDIDGDVLSLSDKQNHFAEVSVGDIVVVGKATDKIFFLGSIVSFLKEPGNRLLFYVAVGAFVLILLGVTIILHISLKPRETEENEPLPVYSLEDLIQVESEPIPFEKALKKEEELLIK